MSRNSVHRPGAIRVLVVEDDPGIADVLEFALGAAGHAVRLESTGAGALRALDAADFVVLDIGLPDMDGFEVCREIRKVSEVPVLMLTSRSDEIDRVVGLELGADDYLTKPFSTRELVARLKAINRRRAPMAPRNGLHLDRERWVAEADGSALDLSRTEFELLALLAAQPGRVFTRAQILDHAWSDGGCVTDRTVDAHIKSLRRKLPEAELIETVRGFGYRLRAS